VSACTVCGRSAVTGHEHTSLALCTEHAAWWSEALTERTVASDWDRNGDLRDDAHDAILSEMREDHAASLVPVMTSDPLDGLSLYGVGGAA